MSDLVPCPFCKKEVYPGLILEVDELGAWATYRCPECRVEIRELSELPYFGSEKEAISNSIVNAKAAWNTRQGETRWLDEVDA